METRKKIIIFKYRKNKIIKKMVGFFLLRFNILNVKGGD
jgi:hypothetical protein